MQMEAVILQGSLSLQAHGAALSRRVAAAMGAGVCMCVGVCVCVGGCVAVCVSGWLWVGESGGVGWG